MSRLEIERIIISLGFQRVVFIHTEPEDVISYANGIVRFVSPSVLLVNDYSGKFFNGYRRRLLQTLKKAKLKVQIVPFPWYSTGVTSDGVWSAVGCYINFIQTAKGIVLPAFGHLLDGKAAESIAAFERTPTLTVDARRLARFGGVLNCVSLTY